MIQRTGALHILFPLPKMQSLLNSPGKILLYPLKYGLIVFLKPWLPEEDPFAFFNAFISPCTRCHNNDYYVASFICFAVKRLRFKTLSLNPYVLAHRLTQNRCLRNIFWKHTCSVGSQACKEFHLKEGILYPCSHCHGKIFKRHREQESISQGTGSTSSY